MRDYEAELLRLIDFVKPFSAELRMVHLASRNDFVVGKVLAEASIAKKLNYKVEVVNREWNVLHSILQNISAEAKRYSPSLITFFTHQSRSFLEKLVPPSNAAEYSFYGQNTYNLP